MIAIIYLICGTVFELFILNAYRKSKVPYTIAEILIGGIIDILAWPIILFKNIVK